MHAVKPKIALCPKRGLRRLVIAWLLSALVMYLSVPEGCRDLSGMAALSYMSPGLMALDMVLVFAALTLVGMLANTDRVERWMVTVSFALLFVITLRDNYTNAFLWGGTVLLGHFLFYGVLGWEAAPEPEPEPAEPEWWSAAAAAVAAVVFFLLVSVWTVSRVKAFMPSTYDLGIFAQMYHSLLTTLRPETTLERDGLLSHFAVHVSPICYLLIPFYWLKPGAETLQVLQAALMASAALPLWKLAKLQGFGGMGRLAFCLLLFVYPAYSGGAGYDFHENAFLTPLILWLFYGIHRKSSRITALFALLTLMVKEDAAVYVAVMGLWLLLTALLRPEHRRWNARAGGLLLGCALIWFLLATGYLASRGDGVMTFRYSNLIYDGSDSLATVVKAVLLCPMKALYEILEQEKVEFLLLTLLPLTLLPLLTRRYERLVLLIPYVLINLLSDYTYQHDIFFQYTFGSGAFLLYLAMVNLRDIRREEGERTAQLLVLTGLLIGSTLFGHQVLEKIQYYKETYSRLQDYYDAKAELLKTVPPEASVASTSYFTPYLSQRAVLYDIYYCVPEHVLEAEYVVIDPGSKNQYRNYETEAGSGYDNFIAFLTEAGYTLEDALPGVLEIYRRQ